MIKIRIIKRLLTEAELKHSETAFNKMFKLILKHFESGKSVESYEVDDIPIEEILYTKNKNLLSGFVAFVELNILKNDTLKNIVNYWDSNTATFSEQIIKSYVNHYSYPVLFILTNKINDQGSVSVAGAEKKAVLAINVELIETKDELQTTLRHELQHLTQLINGHCLKYYDLLKKNRNSIEKVQIFDYQFDDKGFGIGKLKTGLRQEPVTQEQFANMTPEEQTEVLKKYFGDDFEYETWLSELNVKYFDWLKQTEQLKQTQIFAANMKEKIKNNPQQKYSLIKTISKTYNLSDSDSLKRINMAPSLYELATEFIKKLITNERIRESFSQSFPNGYNYIHAIIILDHLRKKEFTKDLINNLVLAMKKGAV